ncbi:MAG: radical SAM family heme chaperone HemW, partial [Candidatus Thorarchaeota archaeon]
MSQKLAIYIHWPFCKSKCPYCDFNSYAVKDFDDNKFKDTYIQELHYFKSKARDRIISSIFFGGGTPSLMRASTIEEIIYEIEKLWHIPKNTEISMEANPTSVEIEKFRDFYKAGINRMSLGIQSLYDEDLKFLGRKHNALEAKEAIKTAAKVFGNRYSIDLIYARPKQTLHNWQLELEEAINLSPYHISLYQLTVEQGTRFYQQEKDRIFIIPNGKLSADFYNL